MVFKTRGETIEWYVVFLVLPHSVQNVAVLDRCATVLGSQPQKIGNFFLQICTIEWIASLSDSGWTQAISTHIAICSIGEGGQKSTHS